MPPAAALLARCMEGSCQNGAKAASTPDTATTNARKAGAGWLAGAPSSTDTDAVVRGVAVVASFPVAIGVQTNQDDHHQADDVGCGGHEPDGSGHPQRC